jgi:hypothetical protein
MIPESQEMSPVDGVIGLLGLFDQFPIVALGEMHGLEQEAAFIADLVRHPLFPQKVQAIVVEFGNALFQDAVDRYIAGDAVALRDLRPVWRDFAGSGPWGFMAPIYEHFFHMVRAVNQALPPERRLRVLLGDPPVDWQALHTPEDAKNIIADRDGHFARVVEEEVLQKGKRALLIAGGFHFLRAQPWRPPAGLPRDPATITQILDRRYPSATFFVSPHIDIGFPDQLAELEARLASWPTPGFASVAGTWLGALPARTLFGGLNVKIFTPAGITTPFADSALTIADILDGYLYLGPCAAFTYSQPDPTLFHDEEYMSEVKRRTALMPGPSAKQLQDLGGQA